MIGKPNVHIDASRRAIPLSARDISQARELLRALIHKELKLKYRQTLLGCGWALFQPAALALVVTYFVSNRGLGRTPLGVFQAVLPWQLFAYVVNQTSRSLLVQQSLIKKVFFPRLLLPLASTLIGAIDYGIGLFAFILAAVFFRLDLLHAAVYFPWLLLLTLLFAFATGLWVCALTVRYRDLHHALPFLVQLSFFLTPIAYSRGETERGLLVFNPLTGIIEGCQSAFAGQPVFTEALGYSVTLTTILLVSGLFYFRRVEATLDDHL